MQIRPSISHGTKRLFRNLRETFEGVSVVFNGGVMVSSTFLQCAQVSRQSSLHI